jgi:hypothetical protein
MVDTASILIACISLLGTICTAGFAAWATLHIDYLKRRTESQRLIDKYSDPLLLAAMDLQSRIFNIIEHDFLKNYPGGPSRREFVILWTIFLFGQYFSWVWILRYQIQYLKFSTDKGTRNLAMALNSIRDAFRSNAHDEYRHYFMLWYGQQIGIGEVMSVTNENSKELVCMGYAQFEARYRSEKEEDKKFTHWFKPVEDGIDCLTGHRVEAVFDRLAMIQHLLLDLIKILDPKGLATSPAQSALRPVSRRLSKCHCESCEGIGHQLVRHEHGDHRARRADV